MTDIEDRVAAAHRAAFAAITGAINSPDAFDAETVITDFTLEANNPPQALLDIAHALVWHAAGALWTHTNGDREAALKLVQEGALMQEVKHLGH